MLLASRPVPATESTFRVAIVDQNLWASQRLLRVASPSSASRAVRAGPHMLVFRALNDLWDADDRAQPMIALLCSTARDPILRATTPSCLAYP